MAEAITVVGADSPEAVVYPIFAGLFVKWLACIGRVNSNWEIGVVDTRSPVPGAVAVLDTEEPARDITTCDLIVVTCFVRSVQSTCKAEMGFELLDLLASLLRQYRAAGSGLVKASKRLSEPVTSLTRGGAFQGSALLSVSVTTGPVGSISAESTVGVPLATGAVASVNLSMANSFERAIAASFSSHVGVRKSSTSACRTIHDTAEVDLGRFESACELIFIEVIASLGRACV